MTTKLTDEQRAAVEACAGGPVRISDEVTNEVYYLVNEQAFVHLRGLQLQHDEECAARLRELIAEGIRGEELPAEQVFSELRTEANRLAGRRE